MCRIKLITKADEYWNGIASLLDGEVGEVSGSYSVDGKSYHSAVFENYGAEFSWIPSEFCEVVE